jgi:glutamine cyclotransferase
MLEKVAIKNGQSIETDNFIAFTSKEDHTYVTGEIYQRVIAIRKSKKDR